MRFDDIDHGFCESHGYELPHPEIINYYTSFFISFIGLLGLYLNFLNHNHSQMMNLINCLIIVNGIGAAGFHYTQQKGWSVIDELSMTIALVLGTSYSYSLLLKYKIKKEYYKYRMILDIILNCIFSFYLIFCYTITLFVESRHYFPLIFFCPSISLLIPIYFFRNYYIKKNKKEVILINKGIKSCFISFLIWFSIEMLCDYIPFIQYIPGHGLWHIGFSYGMFLLLQFMLHFSNIIIFKRYDVIEFKYCIPFIKYSININKN